MAGLNLIVILWGLLMTIAGYFIRGKFAAYDKHLDECNAQKREDGRASEKIEKLEKHADKMDGAMTWVGDCLVSIAAKMKVDLPSRP